MADETKLGHAIGILENEFDLNVALDTNSKNLQLIIDRNTNNLHFNVQQFGVSGGTNINENGDMIYSHFDVNDLVFSIYSRKLSRNKMRTSNEYVSAQPRAMLRKMSEYYNTEDAPDKYRDPSKYITLKTIISGLYTFGDSIFTPYVDYEVLALCFGGGVRLFVDVFGGVSEVGYIGGGYYLFADGYHFEAWNVRNSFDAFMSNLTEQLRGLEGTMFVRPEAFPNELR